KDVTVELAGGIPRSADGGQPDAGDQVSSDWTLPVAKFEWTIAEALPQFRVENSIPETSANLATILPPSGTETVLSLVAEFDIRSGQRFQFDLELPADVAQHAHLETTQPAQIIRRANAEGPTRFTFFTQQPMTESFRVILRAVESIQPSDGWT